MQSTNEVRERKTDGRRILVILAIFVLAFGIRALAVSGLRHWSDAPSERHGADPVEYDNLARSVLERGEYSLLPGRPTAFRAPGFPFFMVAWYKIFGTSYVLAHVSFCLVGAAGCVLTYLAARTFLPESTAVFAGLFCAFYLPHIYFSTVFFSENLFALLAALEIWLLVRELDRWSWGGMFFAGAVLAYSALVRSFAVTVFPLLMLALLVRQIRNRKIVPRAFIAFGIGFFLVLTPWVVRNYQAFGRLVLVATNGGSTFYGGNNSIVAGELPKLGTWVSTNELPFRDLITAQPDEVSHDKMEWKLGMDWVRANPGKMPRLLIGKFVRSLLPDVDSPNRAYVLASLVVATPLIGLFLFGFAKTLWDKSYWTTPWMLVHAFLIGTLMTCLIFWGSPRFRDAIAPLLMIYAAVGASGPISWATSKWGKAKVEPVTA